MVPSLRQERLTSLKIMPLEKRRIRGDLIETFKILKQMDKVDASFFSLQSHIKIRNQRKQFFTKRFINHWKVLPTHVVNAKTVNAFKNRSENYWSKLDMESKRLTA